MTGMCDTSGKPGKKKSKKVAKKKSKKTVYATRREPITELAHEGPKVKYSMGMTINKGNYESVRVDCSLEMPCYSDDVNVVQGVVKDTVVKWLEDAVVEVKNALGIAEQAEEEAHGDLKLEETPETTPKAQESGDLDTPPWDDGPSKEPISKDTVDGLVDDIVKGDDLLKELMDG